MNLLEYYKSGRRWVTRPPLDDIKDSGISHCSDIDIRNAINYANRDGDIDILKKKAQSRFAMGIRKRDADPANQQIQPETFVRGDAAIAFDLGLYEIVPTGFFTRVIKAHATLSTQPDANITFVDPDQEEAEEEFFGEGKGLVNTEQTEELVNHIRERGNFDTAFEGLDFAASAVEVAYMHTYPNGYDLEYDVVLPDDIWFVHSEMITHHSEGMPDIVSPTDKRKINQATAVVIQMDTAASEADESVYLAYVGGCEDWPDGRMVQYQASQPWPLPKGDEEDGKGKIINENTYPPEGGTPCNPLTRILNHGDPSQKECITTEFPIVEWRGGYRTIDDNSVIPATTSLYEASREIDIAWSRLLRHTQANVMGHSVWTSPTGSPGGTQLPRSIEYQFLQAGLEYTRHLEGAAEGQTAVEVLVNLSKQVAGGYFVPGYMVIEHGAVPEAAAALAIQSRPLVEHRNRRFKVNKPKMAKQFEVERALLVGIHGNKIKSQISPTIKQVWDPGTWTPPQDEYDRLEEISYAEDKGYISKEEAFRRANKLSTIQEAKDKMDDPEQTYKSQNAATSLFGNAPPKPGQKKEDEQDNGPQGSTPEPDSGSARKAGGAK